MKTLSAFFTAHAKPIIAAACLVVAATIVTAVLLMTPSDSSAPVYQSTVPVTMPEDVTRMIRKTGNFVDFPTQTVSEPETAASSNESVSPVYELLLDAKVPLVNIAPSAASEIPTVSDPKPTASKPSTPEKKILTDAQLKALSHQELLEINPEYYGMLTVEGPGINEIVCVGKNYDSYLRKNFYGKYYYYGTIFAEPGISQSRLERNVILYGHNTGKSKPNDNKFGKLRYFRTEGYAKSHPYIYLDTPLGKFKYQIFTVFLSPDFLPAAEYLTHFNRRSFASDEEMKTFEEAMLSRSMVDCGVTDFTGKENLVTLVTCMYDFEGAKLIVMAKQVN